MLTKNELYLKQYFVTKWFYYNFDSPNQQIINGISLPQQPLPLVQQQQQFVQQQVQTAPSTSKTTIIKAEVPNTPLAVQQIQVCVIFY